MFRFNVKLVLAIVMVALLCLAGAAVAEESDYTFTYKVLEDGTASITGTEEEVEGKLTIPETIDGYIVTQIGNYAFSYNYSMTEVVLPDTVRRIDSGAFESCESLCSVQLSENLESIGSYAFSWCYELTDIVLPESLKVLSDGVFNDCGLTEIVIPDSVEELGGSVFANCGNLRSVKLPAGIEEIPDKFLLYTGIIEFKIPDSVKTIGKSAFNYSQLESIVIPDGVETIGSEAFYCPDMEYAVIPASVTTMISVDEYDEPAAIFDADTKLYVCENSAAHAYALEFGNEYVLTDSGKPEIYEVETTGRRYEGVGDSVTWTIRAIGSEELSYYFRLYKEGEVIISCWQDSPELTYTFAETGHYTLKTAVKTPEGAISEYFWISSFHVIEEMPEVPTVTDFKLDVSQSVTTGTPITWSCNIIGGSGDFVDALDYMHKVSITYADGETEEDDYVGYTYWGVDGGLFIRGSYIPRQAGTYRITMIPTDEDGLEGEKYTFPKITVKDPAFTLSKVTHDMSYYEYVSEYEDDDGDLTQETDKEYYVRKGDKVTWKFTPKNAKGDVVYTLRILELEVDPTRVHKQIVSESPEITVEFDSDCYYPAWQVTAYDKGSGSYYSTEPEWFTFYEENETYFPYDWDVESEIGYSLTSGQENTWWPCEMWEETDFQQRIDNGEFLFRYEFWDGDDMVHETEWSAESKVSYTFVGSGYAEVVCFLKDQDGYIHQTSCSHDIYAPDSEEEEFEIYGPYVYTGFDGLEYHGGIEWSGDIWHNGDCGESNCGHVTVRYNVHKDGAAVVSSEWLPAAEGYIYTPDDYGVYYATVEYRDENGDIFATKKSEDYELALPRIDHFGISGGYEGTAIMGNVFRWYIFAEGGVDVTQNEIQITLLRDGEPLTAYDWQNMEYGRDFEFVSESCSYFVQKVTVSQPGTYAIEVQVRDSKGTLSGKVRSGEVYAVAGAKSDLKINAVYCDWISLGLNSDNSIHWTAVTSGGAGGNEYTFTLLRNGEVYREFEPQKGDTLTWKPDAEGAYTVKVAVRDSEGAEAERVDTGACVVMDSEERTITAMDISAKLICPAVGDKFSLALAVEPANPTVKAMAFASDNEQVAVVNKKGVIEIVGAGDAVITVKTLDGSDIERKLVIHACEYTAAVLPAALDTVRAEAFEGSAVMGVDMSNAASVTLEDGAFAGSSIVTLRIPDEVTFGENVFGDNHVVICCANETQAALAQAQDIEFVMLK